ncbi:hypothetical protein AB1K70_18000 [Bremerella sp. JC770]|uniref:hypothetical protein n=1 Tax=Bremerella sp. JC770 TaxID=3232137 RepID=UPI00345907FC
MVTTLRRDAFCQSLAVLVLIGGSFAAAGCTAQSDRSRIPVSGMVTVDGEPLDKGTIQFFPHGQTKGPLAGGRIEEGFYHLDADAGPAVGEHLVRIAGKRRTGRMIKVPPDQYAPEGSVVEEMVDIVPARYGENSDLVRDIAAPSTEINFELDSK